jgi:DNA-binding transcriptional ArsR family regulator
MARSLDPATLVGMLADEARLKAFAAVALGACTAAEVADRAGLETRAAVKALERLAGAGLVVDEPGQGLRVEPAVFRDGAKALAAAKPEVDPAALGATPEQVEVLKNFLGDDGRLARIPAAHGKRLVVLDFLSQQFEPGRSYPERDVNFLLGKFHRDYAALRRYLVDEGFLERRDNFYWRAGGTFEIDGAESSPKPTR